MLRLRKFMFDRVYLGEAARREHERVQRTLRGLFDHYMEHPEEVPPRRAGGERLPARHRLHRRDDRPLLHRPLHRADRARGRRVLRATDGADLLRQPRAGQAGGRHRRGGLRPHRPAPPGGALGRPLPLPRGAHARRSRSTPRRSSTTASAAGSAATRSSSSRRRRGSASPRRSSCSPTATGSSSSARRRTRGPRRGGSSGARLEELLDRTAAFYASYLWDSEEAGKARDYLAERGLGEEALRAVRGRLRAERLGHRSCCAASGPASRSTSCAASGSSSGGGEGASTTASAPGSCSRSATAAAAPSASAAGRCAPTRAPSTSTRPRPTSSTRARCSTGSTAPRRRSPRRGGRSSSRATPTCSRCTRRGSRRRSG